MLGIQPIHRLLPTHSLWRNCWGAAHTLACGEPACGSSSYTGLWRTYQRIQPIYWLMENLLGHPAIHRLVENLLVDQAHTQVRGEPTGGSSPYTDLWRTYWGVQLIQWLMENLLGGPAHTMACGEPTVASSPLSTTPPLVT